ncbi:MAG: GNAT family protein [Clostridia bacterium]|nr:GNAT family protein [Clostridia bacterium]
MRLRPYKRCDAETIEKWISDRDVFLKWGGQYLGEFPVTADVLNDRYFSGNGNCTEEDNFYPWTAIDDDNRPVGHFIMRYVNGDHRQIRFGWVVVDDALRGKGYGKQMLCLGLKYAFEILGAQKVTLGVFEHNDPAHCCYRKAGFTDTGIVEKEPWNLVEMEILKQDYMKR